ncbi:MAG: hypothetical protein K2L82_06150 [Lachnospiraceae bacterium]|nr:hypothetical protein [Lachnospiraceae bacterium]
MGNLQNAGAGLRKMFIASIGAIICAVLVIIPIVNILAGIAAIVFGVLSLVGLYGAGKDIAGCKTAFTLTIINMVVSVAGTLVGAGFLGIIFSIADSVLSFLICYLVCTSVSEVMNQIGAADVASKGALVWKINAVCYAILIIIAILGAVPGLALIASLAAIGVLVASLVASIFYMIFLNKSSQALGA